MATSNTYLESRGARTERREREQAQKASRSLYSGYIKKTNDHAIKFVLAKSRADKVERKRAVLRAANLDESQAPMSKWTWSGIILIALMAVVAIDYLIIGGTLDYLLGMQRELQGMEEYYLYLKLLGTFALLTFEIAIAIGLVLLREKAKSRLAVFFHWFIGIGLALALTAFAFGLIYTKIKNESVDIPTATQVAPTDSATSFLGITYSEIPFHKKVLVAGLCCVCFFVHIFALIKSDSVSEAFSLAGYGVKQTVLALKGAAHRLGTERAAGNTEHSYRQAYDQFDAHASEFPNDPLPSVPSQQDPNQRIPVMRLSPVAQRIIESLQNGAIENLSGATGNQNDPLTVNTAAQPESNDEGVTPVPSRSQAGAPDNVDFRGDNQNVDTTNGNRESDIAANGDDNQRRADQRGSTDAADAETEYLRTILDAQVRDSEGEV